MRNLQKAVAVLLVLLVTESAVALASGPAATIEITYSYSNDPSTAKPLEGALVNGPFYIFFDPGLPDDTFEAIFWIDRQTIFDRPVGTSSTPPFSIRYDPSSLSYGPHRLYVLYEFSSSPGKGSVEAYFSVGGEVGEVQFAVYADSHICNPSYPPNWPPWPAPSPPTKWPCQYKTEKDHKRARLEDVGARLRTDGFNPGFVVALGDAIEDLYLEYTGLFPDTTTPLWYFKYLSETFPYVPHYTVLGNHDIRDYGKKKSIHLPEAVAQFTDYSSWYRATPFIPVADEIPATQTNGWHFYLLHSGEAVHSFAEGSCVRFSIDQLLGLDAYLDEKVSGKTAILFWHVSPEGEIRGTAPTLCQDTADAYIDLLENRAPKIKAVITGHVHAAKSYIWNTTDGSVRNSDTHDFNPINSNEIMMITAPSTGYPPDKWDSAKYPDLFLEVSLHPDGTLSIDNKNSIQWARISVSEPPTPVFGESRYTQADSCFEQDNDGDGWFNDDRIDCPGGTYLGTELDSDSNQQTYPIEAELRPSCKVRNYTPGEYDAVSSAETGETALEDLVISQHYEKCTNRTPPISKLNPKRGGGAVAVVVTGPDGVARQIANANTRDYTDHASGISVVAVEHNDRYTEAHLANVPEDYDVRLYVRFGPGLTDEFLPEAPSCDVETSIWLDYEDPAFAEYFGLEVVVSDSQPELSSPPDGGNTGRTAPTFAWSAATGAGSYRIQVDNDADFSSPEIDSEVSGTSLTPATPLSAGSYHWRVRAATDCGHGAWSPAWSFKQLGCIHLPVVMREN